MAAEAEAKVFGAQHNEDDTFLTGLMQGKKQASEGRRSSAHSARKPVSRDAKPDHAYSDMNAADIEEELRDVVFDYENSQALVLAADDFLNDKKPTYQEEEKSEAGQSTSS